MDKNYLKIGSTEFYVPHLHSWDKEKFTKIYAGKVTFDLNNAWLEIQDRLKELGFAELKEDKKIKRVDAMREDFKTKGSQNVNRK